MKEKLEKITSSKQSIFLWAFAFLFLFTSFVLSFFNIAGATTSFGSELILNGRDLYFGANLNIIMLLAFLLLFITMFVSLASLFVPKLKYITLVMTLVVTILYIITPIIVNHPNPSNPEVTLFGVVNYTPTLAVMVSFLISAVVTYIVDICENKPEWKPMVLTVREITELAMLIGLAVVLNFFPKIPLQWAGSVNFQIVPLVIIALRFSTSKTLFATGVIFGLITVFTDGYGLYAYPMEYLVAFGSVAIISPFRKIILKDLDSEHKGKQVAIALTLLTTLISVQTVIRFFAASIDSVVFYAGYLEGENIWIASFIYNAPYVFLTGVATILASIALYYPVLKINKMFKNN